MNNYGVNVIGQVVLTQCLAAPCVITQRPVTVLQLYAVLTHLPVVVVILHYVTVIAEVILTLTLDVHRVIHLGILAVMQLHDVVLTKVITVIPVAVTLNSLIIWHVVRLIAPSDNLPVLVDAAWPNPTITVIPNAVAVVLVYAFVAVVTGALVLRLVPTILRAALVVAAVTYRQVLTGCHSIT